jgi:hypothetical protein
VKLAHSHAGLFEEAKRQPPAARNRGDDQFDLLGAWRLDQGLDPGQAHVAITAGVWLDGGEVEHLPQRRQVASE